MQNSKTTIEQTELINNSNSLVNTYYSRPSTYDEKLIQEKVKDHMKKIKQGKFKNVIENKSSISEDLYDWDLFNHRIFFDQIIDYNDGHVLYNDHFIIEAFSIISKIIEEQHIENEDQYQKYLDKFDNFEELYFSESWLNSYRQEQIDEETETRNIEIAVKGIWKCQCGNDQISFKKLQVRSGDEGMTTFLNCKKCNNTWREE